MGSSLRLMGFRAGLGYTSFQTVSGRSPDGSRTLSGRFAGAFRTLSGRFPDEIPKPSRSLADDFRAASGRPEPMQDAQPDLTILDEALVELPYIPDFLMDDLVWWFVPTLAGAKEAYHELLGRSAADWTTYYTKKGWRFIHTDPREAEGPFRVKHEGLELRILPQGRIFAPKPLFWPPGARAGVPLVSMAKQKPLNPWKPTYLQALNFIKRYEWPHPLPRSVHHAIWEIEECGQIAGSVSWKNAEAILLRNETAEVRETLSDIFYNRLEDYPLGSEVYLRVLGKFGPEGFAEVLKLSDHPISRKRKVVAHTLGELRRKDGIRALLKLLEDEDPEVRTAALRALGRLGVGPEDDPEGKVKAYLECGEIPKQVWSAQALLRGGDESHARYLVALVKEEPRLLTDMGELGDVLGDLGLDEAVPYLINRLKHEKSEFRADAAEALAKVTGLDIEYQSMDTEEQRRAAIKAFTRWWEEKKKERRKSR